MLDLRTALRFEDDDTLLIWGTPTTSRWKDRKARREDRGDRTIYHWGEHVVLQGLRLDLSTMFWNFGAEAQERAFRHIEHWVVGDLRVENELTRVRNHMTQHFGSPSEEQTDTDGEYSAEWQLHGATVNLCKFEQHCFKLHLVIRQRS